MAQDDYYGCASLLGHNDQKVVRGILFYLFFKSFHCPFNSPSFPNPQPPPSSNYKLTLVQPSSHPSARKHVPHSNPRASCAPAHSQRLPVLRRSLPGERTCQGPLRHTAGTQRGQSRRAGRPCWRGPARKLTRRDPS